MTMFLYLFAAIFLVLQSCGGCGLVNRDSSSEVEPNLTEDPLYEIKPENLNNTAKNLLEFNTERAQKLFLHQLKSANKDLSLLHQTNSKGENLFDLWAKLPEESPLKSELEKTLSEQIENVGAESRKPLLVGALKSALTNPHSHQAKTIMNWLLKKDVNQVINQNFSTASQHEGFLEYYSKDKNALNDILANRGISENDIAKMLENNDEKHISNEEIVSMLNGYKKSLVLNNLISANKFHVIKSIYENSNNKPLVGREIFSALDDYPASTKTLLDNLNAAGLDVKSDKFLLSDKSQGNILDLLLDLRALKDTTLDLINFDNYVESIRNYNLENWNDFIEKAAKKLISKYRREYTSENSYSLRTIDENDAKMLLHHQFSPQELVKLAETVNANNLFIILKHLSDKKRFFSSNDGAEFLKTVVTRTSLNEAKAISDIFSLATTYAPALFNDSSVFEAMLDAFQKQPFIDRARMITYWFSKGARPKDVKALNENQIKSLLLATKENNNLFLKAKKISERKRAI